MQKCHIITKSHISYLLNNLYNMTIFTLPMVEMFHAFLFFLRIHQETLFSE